MTEFLNHIDTEIFLFLNGLHNPFFDFLMYWISDKYIWIPMYLVLLYFVIRNYGKRSWFIIFLLLLVITLSDQLSVWMKNYFERLRPCHQDDLQMVVHTVKGYCGGTFGFVSSHASNSFSLAVFLIPFLKPVFRYFNFFILVWAAVVSYSRIYLGVHFPGDVIGGFLLGIFVGYLVSRIYFLFYPRR